MTEPASGDRGVLLELVRHMRWANAQVAAACADLSSDMLEHREIGTYGRIDQTLVHLARAQGGYVRTLTGWQPGPDDHLSDQPPFPHVERLAAHMEMTAALLLDALPTLDLDRRIQVTGDDGPYEVRAWVVLLQAAEHAVEHRQQIATMLTAIGVEPPEPDLWTYWREVAASS